MVKTNKKLIEVALPLDAINKASAREKSIRHGHPSTLHLWWARRPLAAARAVIFAQMVDDPSAYVDTLLGEPSTKRAAERERKKRLEQWEKRRAAFDAAKGDANVPEPGPKPTLEDVAADIERERLFRIIEDLVLWENTTNEEVLQRAREEIWQSWRRTCALNADHPRAKELFDRHKLPAFHDPFAGGGALPLEAQRLGLEAYASDLNPVAVLINKAMIEIPPKFAGKSPVNPKVREEAKHGQLRGWKGAEGLAEDVRYYGRWIRDEAQKRIGHLFPRVEITTEMAKARKDLTPLIGKELTIVAWIWVRTVNSPNPAFANVKVPLASSFVLSPMAGKEAHVEPIIKNGSYQFTVKTGMPNNPDAAKKGTKVSQGAFSCIMSGTPIPYAYIDAEASAGRMGVRLMAIVAEGQKGRVYLSPTDDVEKLALSAQPTWRPDAPSRGTWASNAQGRRYGFHTFGDYFTKRQLVALTTFSDLVLEAREQVLRDIHPDGIAVPMQSPVDSQAYADAIAIYLGFLVSKLADKGSTLCTWDAGPSSNRTASGRSARAATVRVTFSRQAISMTWDFAEVNFFSDSVGSIETVLKTLTVPLEYFTTNCPAGHAEQIDAQRQTTSVHKVVSTDPPYYDNIGYADLSDFFYVWLRRSLRPVIPSLFVTVAVPKAEELVAERYRHGSNEKAEEFFLTGMTRAMHVLAGQAHPAFPLTIYYAFKQSETEKAGTASTGWDTFLAAVIKAGLTITGTWPIRTELANKMIGVNANMLASSIVLVCQVQAKNAPIATRRDFLNALKIELPPALANLQRGNIAPVDLAQAAIGPGMAVFTRYAKVLGAQGNAITVREALAIINEVLDEALAQQEADFDTDTRWALAWFEQLGFDEGEFGVADVLARAKATAVASLVDAGIVRSGRGKVRLLKPGELPPGWDPLTDTRLTVWEMVQHLIRVLEVDSEPAAAALMAKLGGKAETARELCYRLYTICERKKRAAEALSYNALVQAWPELVRLAQGQSAPPPSAEPDLFART